MTVVVISLSVITQWVSLVLPESCQGLACLATGKENDLSAQTGAFKSD